MILERKFAVSFVPCVGWRTTSYGGSGGSTGREARSKTDTGAGRACARCKDGQASDAQTIVVVGDTIQSIAPTASVSAGAGDAVVDLGGMTVMPGLIDVHTH